MNFNLVSIFEQTKQEAEKNSISYKIIKSCSDLNYDYLSYMLKMKTEVETRTASIRGVHKIGEEYTICTDCKCDKCIKSGAINLLYEINNINRQEKRKIKPIDVIDYILKSKSPEFKTLPDEKFF